MRTRRHGVRRIARNATLAVAATVALFCALLLAIRFVVYPQIEAHSDDIAAMLSRELGQPVAIDAIGTGWDGWSPRLVVHGLRVWDAAQPDGPPVLEFPSAAGVVSWTSLLLADLRLKELSIDGIRLAFRRDREGRVHMGGMALQQGADERTDSRASAWLLRQPAIAVRHAVLSWTDELRGSPPLVLEDVDFRLENRLGEHRFGLRGTPPADIASPIDVRGELTTLPFADWKLASGRLYVRLDYADMAAWSKWLPIEMPIENGRGSLRLWSTFIDGQPVEVVADVELVDLRTRLAQALEPLDVGGLSGRISWRRDGPLDSLAMTGLTLVGRKRGGVARSDVTLDITRDALGSVVAGRLTATHADIGLLSSMAAQLPLPAGVRQAISAHEPRGELSQVDFAWDGDWQTPSGFRAQANVTGAGARAHGEVPGFSGWSGRIEANESGGITTVTARNANLSLPNVLAQPITIATAEGEVQWERREGRWRVDVSKLSFANADAAGSLQGWWQARAAGPGEVDIEARITRADGRQVYRYLPRVLGDDLRNWLRDSLLAGTSDDARLVLRGDLSRFPFADGSGTFLITARANAATLDYANGWPRIANVDGELRFERNRMTIVATRGEIAGATLSRATATIDDLLVEHPVLVIEGDVTTTTPQVLAFVRTSPVSEWAGHGLEGIEGSGSGRLALKLELPLHEPDAVVGFEGRYQLIDNELSLPDVPALSRVNGTLAFTERGISASDVAVEAFGGPAKVSLNAANGRLEATAAGEAALASVHQAFATPLASRVTGSTDWRLTFQRTPEASGWKLESSLRGVAIDLPMPLAKASGDEVALAIERRPARHDAASDTLVVRYGPRLRAVAHRSLDKSGARLDRALLLLGKAVNTTSEPQRGGIVIRGDVPALDVDAWVDVSRSLLPGEGAAAGTHAKLEAVDIEAAELTFLGRAFDDMKLAAQRNDDRWRFTFTSRQADGAAQWEPAGSTLANGRITARLARFDYSAVHEPATTGQATTRAEGSRNPWPEIDVSAERFLGRAGHLGRMELAAKPEGSDWNITRFALVNEAGRIDARGTWRLVGHNEHTDLDVVIDVQDASTFLRRFGLPGEVKGAAAKLTGKLGWPGSPGDYSANRLSGNFSVKVGAGQFTKMDPGVGKLLGVLSLQALPRRITLDFRDVFSEGFAFDTIAGSVSIRDGVMHSDDLLVSGPSAKVMLTGDVDLEKETQQLTVRVQPSLSSVVSTGAGAAAVALLAANPLVGAAVGAGTLLAQRIMQDPIEQIFSYEYAVRGSWSDPVVERSRTPALQRIGDAAKPPAAADTPAQRR